MIKFCKYSKHKQVSKAREVHLSNYQKNVSRVFYIVGRTERDYTNYEKYTNIYQFDGENYCSFKVYNNSIRPMDISMKKITSHKYFMIESHKCIKGKHPLSPI